MELALWYATPRLSTWRRPWYDIRRPAACVWKDTTELLHSGIALDAITVMMHALADTTSHLPCRA